MYAISGCERIISETHEFYTVESHVGATLFCLYTGPAYYKAAVLLFLRCALRALV
jgi:hypothetical protein